MPDFMIKWIEGLEPEELKVFWLWLEEGPHVHDLGITKAAEVLQKKDPILYKQITDV